MISYNWTRTDPIRNDKDLVVGWVLGLRGDDLDSGNWAYRDAEYFYDLPQVLPLITKAEMNQVMLKVKKDNKFEEQIAQEIELKNNKNKIKDDFSLNELKD